MHRVVMGLVFVALGFSLSAANAVETSWMPDEELTATFSGKSVSGHYSSGRTFEETYAADGQVRYADEGHASGGKWSVQAGSFCTIYDNDPAGGCYRVRREGANCYEFYFIARTENQAKSDPRKPDWTARAWFRGQVPTCKDGASV
jgi:hypothetical protein